MTRQRSAPAGGAAAASAATARRTAANATARGSAHTASPSPQSSGTGQAKAAGATIRSASVPGTLKPRIFRCGQAEVRPARQAGQVPQGMFGSTTTRCPARPRSTPGPVAAISPNVSWPTTHGKDGGCRRPACSARSDPQMPTPRTWTSTSPGPGSGSGQSLTIRRARGRSSRTTARISRAPSGQHRIERLPDPRGELGRAELAPRRQRRCLRRHRQAVRQRAKQFGQWQLALARQQPPRPRLEHRVIAGAGLLRAAPTRQRRGRRVAQLQVAQQRGVQRGQLGRSDPAALDVQRVEQQSGAVRSPARSRRRWPACGSGARR